MIPGVDNHKKLAHEVQASFQLLQRASEWCWVKNDHQALPALPCLCQKNFLLLPNSIFTCQDIQRIQQQKAVTYTWALQFWVEKADLPTGGKACLLAGSIVELQEEMKCYVSFSDEDVFNGIALLEEIPIIPPKEATPKNSQPTLADPLVKKTTVDMTMEPTAEKRPLNKFTSWEKVLHPSRPIVTTGQIPPLSRAQGKGLVAGVWGKGWFDTLKPRNRACWLPSQNPPCIPRSWRLPDEQCCHLVLLG